MSLLAFCLSVPVLVFALENSSPRTPDSIKAEYYFLISKLTKWPVTAFETDGRYMNLCVLGDNERVHDGLKQFEGQTVHGRKIRIHLFRRVRYIDICSGVFVSRSEVRELPELIQFLDSRPVLTISDIDGFVDYGGMIELESAGERIVFRANPSCAYKAGLKVDARFLALAKNLHNLVNGSCR